MTPILHIASHILWPTSILTHLWVDVALVVTGIGLIYSHVGGRRG